MREFSSAENPNSESHFIYVIRLLGVGLLALLLLLIALLIFVGPEGYFPFNPAIDTRFAPEYSEEQFQKVAVGMTKEEVLDLLGPPLNSTSHFGWQYSEDNAFPLWDFAWLVRSVNFADDGTVDNISAFVAHD